MKSMEDKIPKKPKKMKNIKKEGKRLLKVKKEGKKVRRYNLQDSSEENDSTSKCPVSIAHGTPKVSHQLPSPKPTQICIHYQSCS